MVFPVVLDACVLIPMPVADLLLRLGAAKQFRPLWSDEILEETERNLIARLAVAPERARSRVEAMRRFFPDATITDYENLVAAMTNDPKDRHVVAAAVRARAELIITFNRKDFPVTSTAPYDITARSPDDFLLDQLDLNQDAVVSVAHQIVQDMNCPPVTWAVYLEGLKAAGLPLFSAALADGREP